MDGWDGNISWTMTSRGHFFSKWANFRGHFQRVTSSGHFLVSSRGHFFHEKSSFFVDIFWVNFSGHFFMVITNSVKTVGQLMQGVQGRSPC